MNVEELGGAPVETHALALVKLAFSVVGWDALLLAGPRETEAVDKDVCWLAQEPSDLFYTC